MAKGGVSRHGGRRPGAGRRALPWQKIKLLAESGSPEQDIVLALEITPDDLADPATRDRFGKEITRAHARARTELRVDIKNRSRRGSKGSPNMLTLRARNLLDWDKDLPPQEPEPDVTAARQRLRDTLERLARNVAQKEGRKVGIGELLAREAGLAGPV